MRVVVSKPAHSHGAAVSTAHRFAQAPTPCRIWIVTCLTPEPAPSAAVAGTVIVPLTDPRAGIEPVGAVLSTVRVSVKSCSLPTASVARARSSWSPSASVVLSSAHACGDVRPEHSVVQEPPAGR